MTEEGNLKFASDYKPGDFIKLGFAFAKVISKEEYFARCSNPDFAQEENKTISYLFYEHLTGELGWRKIYSQTPQLSPFTVSKEEVIQNLNLLEEIVKKSKKFFENQTE